MIKEKILQLHGEGKSYNAISKLLHCSKGLISYYVNPEGKSKTLMRQNRNRFVRKKRYKTLAGGKCQICGYNKCFDALQFHHKDPKEKEFEISSAAYSSTADDKILAEIKKCILVCANCHAEIHSQRS